MGATEIEAVLSGARQDLMLIQGGAMVTQMVATRSKDHGALQARLAHLFRNTNADNTDGWATGILHRYMEDYRLGREIDEE